MYCLTFCQAPRCSCSQAELLDRAFPGAGSGRSCLSCPGTWSFYTEKWICDLATITALPERRKQNGQTAFPSLLLGSVFFFFLFFHFTYSISFFTGNTTFALKYSKQLYLRSFVTPRMTRVHITACMAYGSAYHVNSKVWIMQCLVVIIFYYYQGSFLGSSSFHHLVWNFGLPY